MTLGPDDLRAVRLVLREELERVEVRRKGQRPADVVQTIPIEIVIADVFDPSVRMHYGPCCYLLLAASEVVYAGRSSIGFATRYADHLTTKAGSFERVMVLTLHDDRVDRDPTTWLAGLEGALVHHYGPSLNRHSPSSCMLDVRDAWLALEELFGTIDEGRA